MKSKYLIPLIAGALFLPLAMSGQTLLVPNHSFEDGSPGYWNHTGWTDSYEAGPTGAHHAIEIRNDRTGKDGDQFLVLSIENGNPGQPTSYAYVYSADLGMFEANMSYQLTVSIAKGHDHEMPANQAGIGFRANGIDQGITWYEADSLGYDLEDYSLMLSTDDVPGIVGQQISVVLAMSHAGDYNRGMAFDNIRVSVIPEPSAYATLLGLAVLSLVWFRRRQGR